MWWYFFLSLFLVTIRSNQTQNCRRRRRCFIPLNRRKKFYENIFDRSGGVRHVKKKKGQLIELF